jgi:hypothetical protein
LSLCHIAARYTYETASSLDDTTYEGEISVYGGGGFVQILPIDKRAFIDKFVDLYKDKFTGRATRALFLDFTTYNPNVNMFCIAR